MGAYIAPMDEEEDDGYVSPEFDIPDVDSDEDEDGAPPPPKRARANTVRAKATHSVEDDEELALQLLRGGR